MLAEIKAVTILLLIAIDGTDPTEADKQVCQKKIQEIATVTMFYAPQDHHMFFCEYVGRTVFEQVDAGKVREGIPYVVLKGEQGDPYRI